MSSRIRARSSYARLGAALIAALGLLGPSACRDALAQVPGSFKNWPAPVHPPGDQHRADGLAQHAGGCPAQTALHAAGRSPASNSDRQ